MYVCTPQDFGLIFRRLRKEQGMTQQQVAEWAGLKAKTVSGFETGKVNIQVDTLLKLFAVIGALVDVKDRHEAEELRRRLPW